jgi:hypothetical protein
VSYLSGVFALRPEPDSEDDCYAMTTGISYIPSTWPRRQALKNCVNCGAPTSPSDSQCSYCLTVHGER